MKNLFFILTFILFASFIHSVTRNVPGTYATIQAGIDAAANTDTVLVQPGTYYENINYYGKLITVGSLFLTTSDTSHISSTIIDGHYFGSVVSFIGGEDLTAVLSGCTIVNGHANYGGGIICNNSSPSLKNMIITGNSSSLEGGGISCEDASPSLENVTISGNSAYYNGGGIYCFNLSSPTFYNVTISDNSANRGGGIFCDYNSNPSLENVTITNNTASVEGGGIFCWDDSSPVLINSILWNDLPQEIYISTSSVTARYSDIQDGWTGEGNIDEDPLFADPNNGDYHLTWTNFPIPDATMSPCIDTGFWMTGHDPDGTIADMGAYYYHQTIALDPPQNVTIEFIGLDVHLSWDAVTGAISYKVFSSDDPYTGFVEDTSGIFAGTSWDTSLIDEKKFYRIVASDQP